MLLAFENIHYSFEVHANGFMLWVNDKDKNFIESLIENLERKENNVMDKNQEFLTKWEWDREKIRERLLDILSLAILLENDMELQKSDNVHIRIVKMIHNEIKSTQKSLSENNYQTE